MSDIDGSSKRKSLMLKAFQLNLEGLKRSLSRLLSSPHDVEDVVQETFIRAHLAERKSQIEQPKSYLFKVARNIALNQLRQKMRRPTEYLEDQDASVMGGQGDSLEDHVLAQEKFEILCAAVASLPPQCRKVYLMRKAYALSYKEIAQRLNLSVKTVEMHIQKGYSRCDDYMNEHLGDEYERVPLRSVGKGGRANG